VGDERWGVSQLVLLVTDESGPLRVGVGSEVAEKLADLGVTSVSVLRGEHTTAYVLPSSARRRRIRPVRRVDSAWLSRFAALSRQIV